MTNENWRIRNGTGDGFIFSGSQNALHAMIGVAVNGGEEPTRYSNENIRDMVLKFETNEDLDTCSIFIDGPKGWSVLAVMGTCPSLTKARRYSEGGAAVTRFNVDRDEPIEECTIYYSDTAVGISFQGTRRSIGIRTERVDLAYIRVGAQAPLFDLDSKSNFRFKTTAHFKKWLNSLRSERFGRTIYSNGVSVMQCNTHDKSAVKAIRDVKGVTSVTTSDSSIGSFDYDTLYPILYSRKRRNGGVLSYYDAKDVAYVVNGVGIGRDDRVYVSITVGRDTYYLICPKSVHSYEALEGFHFDEVEEAGEILDSESSTANDGTSEELVSDTIPKVELNDEQKARLVIWLDAHTIYCNKRGQVISDSEAVWFSHYVMSLIHDGQEPTELDQELIGLL
jgi:hypothetical protein